MNVEASAAYHLEGKRLDDGWTVASRWLLDEERTAAAFSVGYLARHDSGRLGYLKAIDFTGALREEDPPTALGELLDSYRFERDLLRRCGDRRLSRVVQILASGSTRVEGANPDAVSYLIFELADGDARDLLNLSDPADCLVRLRAAQHASVGLAQLHRVGVNHQDVKPANVLTWRNEAVTGWESKIGDLGRAHDPTTPAPHDDLVVPGDPAYAPPELLYDDGSGRAVSWRAAADIYMFGSLLCFLTCGLSFGAVQSLYLDPSLASNKFGGTFQDVLPYLMDAYGLAVTRVRETLHKEAAQEVAQMIAELCHPDPRFRGDPVARRRGQNPYILMRYSTRLDLLLRQIPVRRILSSHDD